MKLKEKKDFDLVIQSSLLGYKYSDVFNDQSESESFFKEAKQFGNMVHEVTLKAVYVQYGEITSKVSWFNYTKHLSQLLFTKESRRI